MSNNVDTIVSELDAITTDVRSKFGELLGEQLNWKPSADEWSIGQCIDHLIKTTEIYSGDFKAIADGTRRQGFWESWSPFSGMLGKMLKNVMPKDEKKVKTSERFVPPSDIDADIVERFTKSQEELQATIRSTENVDWDKTKLTSSFMSLVTYSLADAYDIIVGHQRRHIRQAERLTLLNDFPRHVEQREVNDGS